MRLKSLIRTTLCSASFNYFFFFFLILFGHYQNSSYSNGSAPAHIYQFFFNTLVSHGSKEFSLQLASIVLLQPLLLNHICSKQKGFWKLQSIPSGEIHNALWSKAVPSKCNIFVLGNIENHSLVAMARSSLSQTVNSAKCLCHVKGKPTNSKSMKLHSSRASQNNCIWWWGLGRPPCFSDCLVISLKSPTYNHGADPLVFSCLNFVQDSCRLCVSGSS